MAADAGRQLDKLIALVSDGGSMDWEQAESRIAADDERSLLKQLRVVAAIADAHRQNRPLSDRDTPCSALENADRYDAETDQHFSHFQLTEKIGKGGMGVVYKAWDTDLQREVAIKFLPSHLSGRTDFRTRFLREARTAARLNHPNICTIHEVGETDHSLNSCDEPESERIAGGIPYIAMELVNGETLRDSLDRGGPLRIRDLLDIATNIVAGLAAAHEQGIVHRDLKPSNVKVAPGGQVKILDFGLARPIAAVDEAGGDLEEYKHGSPELTQAGTIVGTPAYMSPEQAAGTEVDARSDVFSFGVLLYELATDKQAFLGDDRSAVLRTIQEREPRPMQTLRSTIPRWLNRVVLRCLKKAPEDRYPDARALYDDLRSVERRQRGVKAFRYSLAAIAVVVLLAFVVVTGWPFVTEVEPFFDGFSQVPSARKDNVYSVVDFDRDLWNPSLRDGHLTLWTHRGDTWNENRTGMKVKNIVGYPCTASRFQATTKLVAFWPTKNWQQAGLIVFADQDNYVRLTVQAALDVTRDEPTHVYKIQSVYERGDEVLRWKNVQLPAHDVGHGDQRVIKVVAGGPIENLWLRIARIDDYWTLSFSTDGVTYSPADDSSFSLEPRYIGLVAFHGIGSGEGRFTWDPIPAHFDFLQVGPTP